MREPLTGSAEVPFVDLGPTHADLKEGLLADISALIDAGTFTNGAQVVEFEREFARYCGARHCVGLASGLDALRLALVAAGIESGDEVIVPAMTFMATVEAVTQAGGVPVFADVGADDPTIDVAACDASVGPRTRFLLPVHLYGGMADIVGLRDLAERHELEIVEDAAQAHGAERDGFRAGTAGRAGCFSFYPSKNLGAIGDAGAIITDDTELTETVRALREHGQRRKDVHEREGYTARLDTIQALALLRKLTMLDRWNDERRQAAAFYTEALNGVGDLELFPVPAGSKPVWYVYVVRSSRRAELADHLARRGVATGRHYPAPVHLLPPYSGLRHAPGDFPVAEKLAEEGLSLPLFPGITVEQQEIVVEGVIDFFKSR